MRFELDDWQKEILSTEGNIVLRSGRQVGKSTVIAIKAGKYAVENRNKSIMVISATERQAYLLYSKILNYLIDNHKRMLKTGKDRPTKSEIKLINGSIIRCLPTGMEGIGIRGFTIHILIADEAAFIPQEVWTALTPSLLTTEKIIWLLSTPHGREGYFYERFSDESFKSFHISSEEVAEKRPEPMRARMLKNLEQEKRTMTNMQYAQEYLGEFIDELRQLFPDSLIKKCQTEKRRGGIIKGKDYYLGVDIARMGEDESTFEIVERINREEFEHIESLTTRKTLTTETIDMILTLESQYTFRKIYIDDGGIGAAVFDNLLANDATKRKVIAINNAARPLDRDENKNKKLLKEDLYMNLLALMEKGKIRLLSDAEIFQSLKSVQYEYGEKGKVKIFGNYTHIAEGLIRSVWAYRDKKLALWVR